MSLTEDFFLLFTVSKRREHVMPCKATEGAPGLGLEAEAGVSGKPGPEPLLEFPQERQGRAE